MTAFNIDNIIPVSLRFPTRSNEREWVTIRSGVEDTRLGQGQGQGHKKNLRPRPRPRTAFPRTDTLEAKDRNARGQEPRTQAQVLFKKKKKSSQKFFRRSQTKIFFSSDLHKKTFSKKFFKRSPKF